MPDPNTPNCACDQPRTVNVPVTGLSFDFNAEALSGAISREEIIQIVRDEMQGIPGGGVSYSLEEQWTGGYWIDGKKLYQKTVECGTIPSSGVLKDVPHEIENLDRVIQANGAHWSPGVMHPLPTPWGGNNDVYVKVTEQAVTLWTRTRSSAPMTHSHVTLQYTCTDR